MFIWVFITDNWLFTSQVSVSVNVLLALMSAWSTDLISAFCLFWEKHVKKLETLHKTMVQNKDCMYKMSCRVDHNNICIEINNYPVRLWVQKEEDLKLNWACSRHYLKFINLFWKIILASWTSTKYLKNSKTTSGKPNGYWVIDHIAQNIILLNDSRTTWPSKF